MIGSEREESAVRSQPEEGKETLQQQQLHYDQDMYQDLNVFREAMKVRDDQGQVDEIMENYKITIRKPKYS
jgi:hypothetical protein